MTKSCFLCFSLLLQNQYIANENCCLPPSTGNTAILTKKITTPHFRSFLKSQPPFQQGRLHIFYVFWRQNNKTSTNPLITKSLDECTYISINSFLCKNKVSAYFINIIKVTGEQTHYLSLLSWKMFVPHVSSS